MTEAPARADERVAAAPRRVRRALAAIATAAALAAVPPGPAPALAQDPPGKATYDKWCAGCHGDAGAGDGEAAAYMLPRPRDFTKGVYQIRSTASGELPSDTDIRAVIADGMPGTAMPGWTGRLSGAEIDALVTYLKTFSRFFEGAAPASIAFRGKPSSSDAGIAEGRATFEKLECFKCHGQAGRGDGTSAPTLQDDAGFPIRAADLTASWRFNCGSTVEAVYARLRTGLDGTPMPSFSDVIDAGVITDEQLWRVAQYVRSLSPSQAPQPREVIRAELVAALPPAPDDSAWAAIEPAYVPLAGQIIRKPRWFAPMVEGVWVRAAHDGSRLAMRVSWSDPSRSPDPAWREWLDRVMAAMHRDDTLPAGHGPDRLVVQFPQTVSDGAELPYFLGGDTRRPAHVWRWSSDPDRLEQGSGTGLGQLAPATATDVTHAARFDQGEWQLQFTRALAPGDSAAAPTFTPGRTVAIAFSAADGSNGEDWAHAAVSAWYAIYLDVPTPSRVFVQPILAVLATAGLGLLVVRRAQRRDRRNGHSPEES
jgi:cytochrome c oxidase cbb3-type subunit 2